MIEVVDYDPDWARTFQTLRAAVWPVVESVALSIEHVGSTAVPGLAAKRIIDIDIIARAEDVPAVIARLAAVGYEHAGDLGVPGREAFRNPKDTPQHHLYVCVEGCVSLQNHLAVRDHLRAHPEAVKAYGSLKKQLAARFPNDIDAYVAGKSDLLVQFLSATGMSDDDVRSIRDVNR